MLTRKYLIAYTNKVGKPLEMKVECSSISEAEKIFLETPGIDENCTIEFIELIKKTRSW
jgi:hypothetical protein